jgi:hypothetical protein
MTFVDTLPRTSERSASGRAPFWFVLFFLFSLFFSFLYAHPSSTLTGSENTTRRNEALSRARARGPRHSRCCSDLPESSPSAGTRNANARDTGCVAELAIHVGDGWCQSVLSQHAHGPCYCRLVAASVAAESDAGQGQAARGSRSWPAIIAVHGRRRAQLHAG